MNKKTIWQKIYSALGFWSYNEITDKGTYKVIYWCCVFLMENSLGSLTYLGLK